MTTETIEQRITELTNALLHEYGLLDWNLRLNKARRSAGMCDYTNKEIVISLTVAKNVPWESTLDTILHEIAHAIAGHEAGHGEKWKKIAYLLGVKDPQRVAQADTSQFMPWVGTCPNGHKQYLAAAPRRAASCAECSPIRFRPDLMFDWKKNGETVPMPASYQKDYDRVTQQVPVIKSHEEFVRSMVEKRATANRK